MTRPTSADISEIERRFSEDHAAHLPCTICSAATGRESMCAMGRARYEQMLRELGDPRFQELAPTP